MGLFEIANCFLEGSGTKKSPEVALNYLRLAGDMGDLASQERESPSPHIRQFVVVGRMALTGRRARIPLVKRGQRSQEGHVSVASSRFRLLGTTRTLTPLSRKEAARWYRMAIGQGSSNTFGLAWIWKEKYMM